MAQPSIGTVTEYDEDSGGLNIFTFDVVIDAGSNFGMVMVCVGDGLGDTTHDAVSIDGDACVKKRQQGDTSETIALSLWTRDNPTIGGTIEVIVNIQNVERVIIIFAPATDVDLAAPFGAFISGENVTPATPDAVPSLAPVGAADDLMMSFLNHRDGIDTVATEGANQAMIGDHAVGTAAASPHGYISTEPFNTTASSPVTMDYSMTNGELYAQIAVALQGVADAEEPTKVLVPAYRRY